jgi:hypothetical protein
MSNVRVHHGLAGMVVILLALALLGFRHLNADAIWFDEYYSIFESGGIDPLSLPEMWLRVASYSTWPPAYNTALAGWAALTGWHPLTLRALSTLFGALTVAVVFRLVRTLDGTVQDASVAAVLTAFSAFFIYYTHEMRGYTLHLLLVSLAALLYWRLLMRNLRLLPLIIVLACLLYSHPVGQITFGALFIYHVLFVRRDGGWWRLFRAFFYAGVLYLPWVAVMIVRVAREIQSPRGIDPNVIIGGAFSAAANGAPLVLAAVCLLSLLQWRRRAVRFAWVVLIALLAGIIVTNRFVPFLFHPRLVLAALPFVVVLAAFGLRHLPASLAGAFVITFAALGIFQSNDPVAYSAQQPGAWKTFAWSSFDAALRLIEQRADEDDLILFRLAPPADERWIAAPLHYYWDGRAIPGTLVLESQVISGEVDLERLLREAAAVWQVDDVRVPSSLLEPRVLQGGDITWCETDVHDILHVSRACQAEAR